MISDANWRSICLFALSGMTNVKHPIHVGHVADIPSVQRLVEGITFAKHLRHVGNVAYFPGVDVSVYSMDAGRNVHFPDGFIQLHAV